MITASNKIGIRFKGTVELTTTRGVYSKVNTFWSVKRLSRNGPEISKVID